MLKNKLTSILELSPLLRSLVLIITFIPLVSFANSDPSVNNSKVHKNNIQSSTSKPMVIIMLGAPGSGKGTQGIKLAKDLKLPHISTGDILRENVKQQTELGKKAKSYMDAGNLVPDSLVTQLVLKRIEEKDAQKGYILDGFPRNKSQAEELDRYFEQLSSKEAFNVIAINLNVPDNILVDRILKRAAAKSSEKRSDDTEEVIQKRLKVYYEQTKPVIDYYQEKQQLITIDGKKSEEEVYRSILNNLPKTHLKKDNHSRSS